MKWLIILAACFAAVASAADISGNWNGTAENQGQSIQRTFTFKVDGAKLTGETNSEMLGKSTINDGKVEGDTITFSITASLGGNEMKITYKGKVFLLPLQLGRQVQQAHLAFFFRKHFIEEGEVIAEEQDGAGVGDRRVLAQKMLEKNRCHGRDVFMAEAQVGASEPGVARLDRLDTNMIGIAQHVTREDLLGDGHGARLGVDRRQKNLALQARHVERGEAALLHHQHGR